MATLLAARFVSAAFSRRRDSASIAASEKNARPERVRRVRPDMPRA
jgi:hypothetical protein